MILIITLYALLASTFTIGKAAIAYMLPIPFVALRMLVASALLLGYEIVVKKQSIVFHRKDLSLFIQLVLFHIYIAFTCEFWGLKCMDSSKAALLYNLSPFFTALLAYWFLNERMSIRKWIGLIIGFLGFVPLLIIPAYNEWSCTNNGSVVSLPEIALLIAVISTSYGWIVVKRLMDTPTTSYDISDSSTIVTKSTPSKKEYYSPNMLNGVSMLYGGILMVITSLVLYGRDWCVLTLPSAQDITQNTDLASWLFTWSNGALSLHSWAVITVAFYMILLVLVANIIFYYLYSLLLNRYSTTLLSFAGFTCSLWAALFGFIFLSEQITWVFFVTVLGVAIGLSFFYYDEVHS